MAVSIGPEPAAQGRVISALAKALDAQRRLEQGTCEDPWPLSLHDVAHTPCQLPPGHKPPHRHRFPGTEVVIQW